LAGTYYVTPAGARLAPLSSLRSVVMRAHLVCNFIVIKVIFRRWRDRFSQHNQSTPQQKISKPLFCIFLGKNSAMQRQTTSYNRTVGHFNQTLMKQFVLVILLSSAFGIAYPQTDRLETDWFLYWQPDTKIQFTDYQRQPDSSDLNMMTRHGTKSMANVQIHSILDYPKKTRKLKYLKEQWYFAPIFCKKCSPIMQEDSIDLLHAQVYFDIAEYCCRVTRKKIAELEKQNYGNGFIGALFPRLVDDMYKLMGEMFGSFGKEVLIDKKPGAYEEWRKSVNEMLEMTKNYATKPIECQRFINEKPYSDEYKESYAVYGKNI